MQFNLSKPKWRTVLFRKLWTKECGDCLLGAPRRHVNLKFHCVVIKLTLRACASVSGTCVCLFCLWRFPLERRSNDASSRKKVPYTIKRQTVDLRVCSVRRLLRCTWYTDVSGANCTPVFGSVVVIIWTYFVTFITSSLLLLPLAAAVGIEFRTSENEASMLTTGLAGSDTASVLLSVYSSVRVLTFVYVDWRLWRVQRSDASAAVLLRPHTELASATLPPKSYLQTAATWCCALLISRTFIYTQ
jgi:uncharacterized protein YqgC (DUF456 family)